MNVPITLKRTVSFEMAHILQNADTGACNDTIHGHSYKLALSVSGFFAVGKDSMLMDFVHLKDACGMLHNFCDHALWLSTEQQCVQARQMGNKKILWNPNVQPTAENMILIFAKSISMEEADEFTLELWETEDSSALLTINAVDARLLDVPTIWQCYLQPT